MCRRDDFPPYPAPGSGEIEAALDATDADAVFVPDPPAASPASRATWYAYTWLVDDLMLYRLGLAAFRRLPPDAQGRDRLAALEVELRRILVESGGPIAKREIETAGGYSAIDWPVLTGYLVERFEGDDRL